MSTLSGYWYALGIAIGYMLGAGVNWILVLAISATCGIILGYTTGHFGSRRTG